MDIYSERIKPLFTSSGKSDLELEKEIGLPRSIIYDWNNGRSKSHKKYADKIAEYFNVTTDYLLGNSDIKNKPTTVSDGELNVVLQDPASLEFSEKFDLLTQEQKEMIIAQMEVLIKNHPSKR